jgi:hypothetical protein
VPLIEGFGLIGNRVDEDCAHADTFTGRQHTQHRVLQKIAADPPALPRAINGQPAKENNRNRARHVPPHPSGGDAGKHRARRQAVVADDPPGLAHHEGARPAFDLVVQAMAFQPLIERLDPGREGIELVILAERLRRGEPRRI